MNEARRSLSLAVLPNSRNRIRLQPKVVACWAVGDGVFDFGHKFIGTDARDDFRRFHAIRNKHPDAPIALFGHTDAVGSEAYNHQLGYERALAVFAVLRHDPDLWFELFRNDAEGLVLLKDELTRGGASIADAARSFGASTLEAVRSHFSKIGPPEPLDVFDFLSAGQAALQSCSEFNPVLLPAPWMLEALDEEEHRVALAAVNRRVVALFFDRATVTNLHWPCPPAGEGPSRCKSRFWQHSQTAIRSTDDGLQWWPPSFRGNPKSPWVPSEQVFACRFYQRLVHDRDCEKVDPYAVIEKEIIPPDPPVPPPPPPPKKRPPKIPDNPVVPRPDPILAEVIVNCEHSFRFNKHAIAADSGEMLGEDAFAVVPPREGDTIYMRVHPESELEHVRLFWDDSLLPSDNLMVAMAPYGFGTRTVDFIESDVDNPLWLFTREEALRRTVRIRVEGRGDDRWTIPIRIYPRDVATFDGVETINEAREWLGDWIQSIEEKLALLIDDFEFKFMPKEGSDFAAEFQWRELPLAEEGKTPTPDHRVMFWWKFAFVFKPFISLKGTMVVSYSKVLRTFRKWTKGTWAEKSIEKIFSWIPQEILDALDAARLEISPTVSGAIDSSFARRSPDEKLDIGPHEDGAAKQVEGSNEVGIKASGVLDTESALLFLKTKVSLKLSLEMGAKFRYGMIASLEKGQEKLGMYLQASTTGLSGKIGAALKTWSFEPRPINESFEIAGKVESDVLRWIAFDGRDDGK